MGKTLRKTLFYAAILLFWQLASSARIWPDFLFPSPAQVTLALWEGFTEQGYLTAIHASLYRLIVGYSLSVVAGIGLGIALAYSELVEETLGSLALGLQTLPSVCWLPLAILWFGLSDAAIIFVIFIGSFLSIAIATQNGIRHVPSLWVQAARTMGAKGARLQWSVVLPAALPALLEGMKQGWSFAWRSLMAGELIFVTLGLGQLMNMGRELNDISRVISVMIIIVAIGIFTNSILFASLERKLASKWGFRKA